jgi:predicted RNase H-like HicB family nuclease
MKYVYPAIFTPLGKEYDVLIPDLPGCRTCGHDLAETIEMAEDAVAMWLWDAENKGENIPAPSESLEVTLPQFVNFVFANTDVYRKKYDNRAVKKTLTLPSWLNHLAEEEGINFSHVLQDALKEKLGA